MPLTDTAIKQAKPRDEDYWLTDEKGLRLLVKTTGSKYWRLKYRFQGKQKTLAVGVYPSVSLKSAREKIFEARRLLDQGFDPSQEKQKERRQVEHNHQNLFAVVAREWWEHQKGTWTENHANRIWGRMVTDVIPYIGDRPIYDVQSHEIISIIRKIEARDALDVAQRVLQDIGRIGSYAVATDRMKTNPARELSGILKSRKQEHRPSLPREQLRGFLQDLDKYDEKGRLLTKLAIQLLILTFVRSGELRGARWEEFDLEEKLWRIPGYRMKMKTEHLVPLASQTIVKLKELKSISGQYELLFPSERSRNDCMSDGTLRLAIYRLGYDGKTLGKTKCVPHGFRATASSILNEKGFNPDAIERQLAHMERNGVRAAYTHHARYLEERHTMMQWWGDYLDSLKG